MNVIWWLISVNVDDDLGGDVVLNYIF